MRLWGEIVEPYPSFKSDKDTQFVREKPLVKLCKDTYWQQWTELWLFRSKHDSMYVGSSLHAVLQDIPKCHFRTDDFEKKKKIILTGGGL